ncbi:DHHC zinc finger domain containing protein [Trichomonas vaginalis G3]|uniref:Palmitoyltransferase n=1 Tax=Trichomonas vaginalis (strain ATCC PRA-98 / G3) TaxID=412133 RepID=A2FUL3_TRIV3|nr:cysteine S-palmitoyltransferase protein [Trichomonas vaginalis G3]EAX91393.1 DHHC zinc finger domain containing protein [Trichomonas vaginalis G3]KAI5545609.1 cysteine S-palmitoyltransferase protein [Trichomonas vaginalis G3]|eukprot:XP_001304323.1 DHHC zinc finger domain containing protein [Trichomonas vaginalis G3]
MNNDWQMQSDTMNAPCPEMSHYDTVCHCCGLDYSKVPIIKAKFLNNWEISLLFPILVSFIILSSYTVFEVILTKVIPWLDWKYQLLMTILMLLFIISYYVGILEGPGYLPFYYPYKMHEDGEDPHELGGLVTTQEQFDFVKSQIPMQRIKYFKTARRIVIRPDHFCLWFATFIGKRNHKLFFLFNFWGFIYISLFFGFEVYGLYKIINDSQLMKYFVPVIIYIFLAFYFVIMTGHFTIDVFYHLCKNVTTFELMQKTPPQRRYKVSYSEGFIEVFGPVEKWYLWLLPIPAFYGIDDYTLVSTSMSSKML